MCFKASYVYRIYQEIILFIEELFNNVSKKLDHTEIMSVAKSQSIK